MIKVFDTTSEFETYSAGGLKSGELCYVAEDKTAHFRTNNIDGIDKEYDMSEGDGTPPESKFYHVPLIRIGFYSDIQGFKVTNFISYNIGSSCGSRSIGIGGAFLKEDHTLHNNSDVEYDFGKNFGGLLNDTAGTSELSPVFAQQVCLIDGNEMLTDFQPVNPNANTVLKLQMRLDYDIVNINDPSQIISVCDAYVEVPIQYTQWLPNYTYTYIFKISDNSLGRTPKPNSGNIPGNLTVGPGRDPYADAGGGDNDPTIDPMTGEVISPYVASPAYDSETIATPLVPNPMYPDGPMGDQHDPSNPCGYSFINDPLNAKNLYPITLDKIIVGSRSDIVFGEQNIL